MFIDFVSEHEAQLAQIPRRLWNKLYEHFANDADSNVLISASFDTSEYECIAKRDITSNDIFIFPHQLTFESDTLVEQLNVSKVKLPGCADSTPPAVLTERIWSLSHAYNCSKMDENGEITNSLCWYLNHHALNVMSHSWDDAVINFRAVLFLHMPTGQFCTVGWLCGSDKDLIVKAGQPLIRNFLPEVSDPKQRQIFTFALPSWIREKLISDEMMFDFVQAYDALCEARSHVSPSWLEHARVAPEHSGESDKSSSDPIEVFTDCDYVKRSIHSATDSRFAITSNRNQAEINFLSKMMSKKEFEQASNEKSLFNQFENDNCLTVKSLFLEMLYSAFGMECHSFYQPSYNLNTQTAEFIGEFLYRNLKGMENNWIVKPWNGTRSVGCFVSASLPEILKRMVEGPHIVSLYVNKPCLIFKKKFDLRLLVTMTSADPLVFYSLDDMIYPRVSNKEYTLNEDFADFETHFTVMKYRNLPVNSVSTESFVEKFEKEYGKAWESVMRNIHAVVKSVFQAAIYNTGHARSIKHLSNSRGLYGVDILLKEDLSPVILEVSMNPDTNRIAETYPTFYADLFELWLGSETASPKWKRL